VLLNNGQAPLDRPKSPPSKSWLFPPLTSHHLSGEPAIHVRATFSGHGGTVLRRPASPAFQHSAEHVHRAGLRTSLKARTSGASSSPPPPPHGAATKLANDRIACFRNQAGEAGLVWSPPAGLDAVPVKTSQVRSGGGQRPRVGQQRLERSGPVACAQRQPACNPDAHVAGRHDTGDGSVCGPTQGPQLGSSILDDA